jgi:hypothetical protein
MSDALPGNPDGALCEAAKMEDGGATTAAAAGVSDRDVVENFANGDPKTDVGFPLSPMFETTGADLDAPKGEKDVFAFTESRRGERTVHRTRGT